MARATLKDLLFLAALGVLWGVSFMAIKAGLSHFDPIFFAAIRYDIAGLLMLAVALPAGWKAIWPKSRVQWKAVWISAALNVMGYHAFLFWGEQYTTSSIAAVVVSLNPIMAMVVARALLPGERVGPGGLLGLLLGLVGIALLVGLKPGELFDARGIGELAVFGCVVSWAFGAVLVKRIGHGMAVIPFTALQMILGALMLHALSLVMEGPTPKWDHNVPALSSLLYLSVLASGIGFFLYFTLLERIGPIRSSLVSYIAPVFATLAGFLVLQEAIEVRAFLAFVLVAVGFRLVIVQPPEAASAPSPSDEVLGENVTEEP